MSAHPKKESLYPGFSTDGINPLIWLSCGVSSEDRKISADEFRVVSDNRAMTQLEKPVKGGFTVINLRRLGLLVALILSYSAIKVSAQTLKLGDPAPKLEVKEFVKGDPLKGFEPGKTYVVEFWATWCGPCRTSIPHLTELQKKYPDITFGGVSVFEQEPEGVKPFVEKWGKRWTTESRSTQFRKARMQAQVQWLPIG